MAKELGSAIDFGGPYYQSDLRKREAQRQAIGLQPFSARELYNITQGELESRYGAAMQREQFGARMAIETGRLGIQERAEERMESEQKSQERANMVSGVATGVSAAAAVAPAIGGIAAGVSSAAAGVEFGGVAAAGYGVWETVGLFVGSLLGCCFTFLEGELLTENVRRYRDEHYDKFTSPISFGYRWMSTWLVPLMKRFSAVKQIVKWIMLKPMAVYADWYYGDNSYGWMFYPLKALWTNAWRLSGEILKRRALKWQVHGLQQ